MIVENFDQLDTLLYENETLIKQVIMFIASATLIFLLATMINLMFNIYNIDDDYYYDY
uniref:CypoGV ORF56 n=1 Tax=Cnaphalocrocis medinalis granulovirus TaxID=1750712 RepID=A0A0X9GJQ3_9BBAC|nr:CypoGV ORF56 [Cnaphalocrocis medinalis granulovirus]